MMSVMDDLEPPTESPPDPFKGLGRALAILRERAGFFTQKRAADTLGFDRAQVSRWENDVLRPTIDSLGQLLVGYNATLADLVEVIGSVTSEVDEGPSDEELLRALAAAIRRVEGRQNEMESRVAQDIEQLKREVLGRGEG